MSTPEEKETKTSPFSPRRATVMERGSTSSPLHPKRRFAVDNYEDNEDEEDRDLADRRASRLSTRHYRLKFFAWMRYMLVLRTSYFFFLVGMVIVVATLIIKAVMNEHETVENRIAFVIGAGMGMVYAWRLIIRCLTYIIFDVFFVGEFKLPVYYIVTLFDRIVYLASFISFAIIWDLVVVNYVFPGEGWSDMDDLFHGSIYNDVYLIALSGITFASAYVLGQFAITGIVREYFTGTFWEKMKAQLRREFLLQMLCSHAPCLTIIPEDGDESESPIKRVASLTKKLFLKAEKADTAIYQPTPRKAKNAVLSALGVRERPNTRITADENAVKQQAWENAKGFPLTYDEMMNLISNDDSIKKMDLVDMASSYEESKMYDTRVWKVSAWYQRRGKRLRISKLLKANLNREEWLEEIKVNPTRRRQISCFAEMLFQKVTTGLPQKLVDMNQDPSSRVFLTLSTVRSFVPDDIAAKNCFKDVMETKLKGKSPLFGREKVSQTEFTTFVMDIFEGRKNVYDTGKDLLNNLRTLERYVQWPINFFSLFIVGYVVGIEIKAIMTFWVSFILGFSFAFSKIFQEAFDGLMYVFSTRPFDVGDSIQSPVVASGNLVGDNMAKIRSIGVYSCIIEGNCGEQQFIKTSILANAMVTNATHSKGWWDNIKIDVDITFNTEKLIKVRNAMLAWFASDPAHFIAPTSYICLKPTTQTGLKVTLMVVVNYAFPRTSSGYLNQVKSRIVEELYYQLSKVGATYTSPYTTARLDYYKNKSEKHVVLESIRFKREEGNREKED